MSTTDPTTDHTTTAARTGAGALVVTLVLVALGYVVDATVAPPAPVIATTTDAPVRAGSSTCAAGSAADGAGLAVVTVADEAAQTADGAASLAGLRGDRAVPLATPDTTGRVLVTPVLPDAGPAVTLRWDGTPVLLSRWWEAAEQSRVPGAVEGPCPTGVAARWLVPGVVTAGGAAAELVLANPTEAAAAVAVTFTTPAGPIEPTRLANLVVPAQGRLVLDLNEFAPEEPDLGVEVVARAGRVVVEAVQRLEAAVGDVDGRSLVVAHPEPATQWTVPWVVSRAAESSWLWVTNPNDEPADVGVVVHTPDGPVVPPGVGLTLAPRTTERLDLRGALGEAEVAGVTVRTATEVPVVVGGVQLRAVEGDPQRSGIAVVEALPGAAGRHAALTVGEPGTTRRLALSNPGDEPATVTVRVAGAGTAEPAVVVEELELAPGAFRVLDPTEQLPEEGGAAILVDVTDGVAVAALVQRSDGEGPVELVVAAARPFPTTTDALDPVLVRDPSLLHPITPPEDEATGPPVDGADLDDEPPSVDTPSGTPSAAP